MFKLSVSTLLVTLFFAFQVFGQGKVAFEKNSHDFGQIKEENGPAEVTFNFKNDGNEPITLTSVKASCGCTTPNWSKEQIQPGETGYVTASYNPRNRPGKFNKSVTVRTDGEPQVMVLRINGEVIPRPKGPSDYYPMEIGNLRFKSSHIAFGNVMHNGTDTASTVIYNQGDAPISIDLANTKLPAHITATIDNAVVQPKQTTTLRFTYDAKQKNDWGYNFENFNLKTSDSEKADKRINISAKIKENFGMSVAAKAPKVKYDKTKHDFGDIQQNDRVSTAFTITNEGQAPLLIRKTKASCGCTASKPQKTELLPGESTTIDVTFSAGSRSGKQKKSVTVITNDPSQDEMQLWIESNVLGGDK